MRASGYAKADNDFYVEPRWLVDALLDVEHFSGLSWDPSCGTGTIPIAMRDRGLECAGSDIVDRGFGQTPLDFFEAKSRVTNIVTNPPFGVIEPYIRRALHLASDKVAILGRLALLESQRRREFFNSTPLARVWVSSRRASMPPGGKGIKATGGTIPFAWFVWDHSHEGPPVLGWV